MALLLLIAAVLPAMASATPTSSCVTQRAFYQAPVTAQSVGDVLDAGFTEFDGVLSRGYRPDLLWLRVRIGAHCGDAADDLVLRVRPSYLDDIHVFDSVVDEMAFAVMGDRHPVDTDAYPSLYFNAVLPDGDTPRDIWVRVNTTSTQLIDIDVLRMDDALTRDRQHELFSMLYIAALVVFLGWGLVTWFESRERLLLVFVTKQFVGLVYSLAYLGYFRLVWPDAAWAWLSPDRLTSTTVIIMVAAAYLFDYAFLKEFHARRGFLLCMKLCIAASPVLLVLLAMGEVVMALKWNNALVVISPLLSLATALLLPSQTTMADIDKPLLPRRYAIILYSLVLASVSLSSLPAAGIAAGAEWSFSGYLMYSLWTGAAVLVMLQIRATKLRRQRLMLATALGVAERRAEAEKAARVEQSRFLAMLTHELKTPLSVLQMVAGAKEQTAQMKASSEQAIKDMGAVIERCLQADRYESGQIVPQPAMCRMDEELGELVASSQHAARLQLDAPRLPGLSTDRTLLRVAVTNLMDNALKYGDPQASVRVRAYLCEREGVAGVAVEVANPPGKAGWPDPEQVFRKYYRHPLAHKATGSGLGLFLVDGLSRLLGGSIDYVPTDTEVVFRLWLPLH